MGTLKIVNGTVVDPRNKILRKADVFIKDEKIEWIAATNDIDDLADETIDASGCFVLPGLVDVHVHFRDPGLTYKEDINTGSMAAAAGGFTSCIMMGNTKPTIDNEDVLKEVLEKASKTLIHLYSCANVTKGMKGQEKVDYTKLLSLGAVGFTDDGIPIMDEKLLREVFEELAELGVPVSLHEEDPAYIGYAGVNDGKVSKKLVPGGKGASARAEYTMAERDIKLAQETGAVLDIQHISSAETVDLLRQARRTNKNIHGEATPHHIVLTEEETLKKGTLAKMNPPLRTEEDRKAIIRGLMDGSLDLIATDHAPHSAEEKAKDFHEAPSGIVGLETSLCLCYDELVNKNGMGIVKLMELMSYNPAIMYGINAGYIREGGPADICIFNPSRTTKVENLKSKSENTPFLGQTLKGKVMMTICSGKIIYTSGDIN